MSQRTIDQLREEMRSEFSYLDVLALALARSGVHTFTGDSERWSEVVRNLREAFPDLLDGIWFTERGYSEQLEDFFRVMARSGSLSFANPRYERIDMQPEVAKRIDLGASEALQTKADVIQKIAAKLATLEYK